MTVIKDLSEEIEIFLCDLLNLERRNNWIDAFDTKLNESIEFKLASRFIIDKSCSGGKRSGRFVLKEDQHNNLKHEKNPHYVFCVYSLNGQIEILGIKKLPWVKVDELIDFQYYYSCQLTISKIFNLNRLRPIIFKPA